MTIASEHEPGGFGPQALVERLTAHECAGALFVAFSGGADSLALLHAAAAAARQVIALHVDHGLHPESAAWAARCEWLADYLGVGFERIALALSAETAGTEERARDARYAVLARRLPRAGVLLTAHHADDQAETVLLRLFRGTGPDGLAGMPRQRALGRGWLIRPLLDVSRASLRQYTATTGLPWIEDPANQSTRHDRSWLRQTLMPQLEARFPELAQRLQRLARHTAESARTRDWLLQARGASASRLAVDELQGLPEPVQRELFRVWLRGHGARPPGERRVCQGLSDLIGARRGRQPELRWADGVVRRFNGELYYLRAMPPTPPAPQWVLTGTPLALGAGGRLLWQPAARGLAADQGVRVSFRQGGERILCAGHQRLLKTLLQEAGMPPWLRSWVPLIWQGGALLAVTDVALADSLAAPGLVPVWERPAQWS